MNPETPFESSSGASSIPVAKRRERRWSLWILAVLVLVLLAALAALQLFVWEVVEPQNAVDTTTFFALSTLLFASFIIFAFILLRNLIKLQRERQRNSLGSKLKTRLVIYFISLSLLPIASAAIFSYAFLNRSLEKWFGRLPEDVVTEARMARANSLAREESQTVQSAKIIAAAIANAAPDADLNQLMQNFRAAGGYEVLEVTTTEGETLARASDEARRVDELESSLAQIPVDDGVRSIASSRAPDSIFHLARVPLADGRGSLLLVRASSEDASLSRIISGAEDFERLRNQQRRVRVIGLSTLGLLTLLLLVATVWTALYLARGLATPIQALAEAATEVARGNLTHRVTVAATDELAVLARSFNEMVDQLEENRHRIEAATAELRDKNFALEERRTYIETVLGSLSTGVISLDENDCITTINAAACAMLHDADGAAVKPDSIVSTNLESIVCVEDFAVLERVVTRARRYGNAIEQTDLRLRSAQTDDAKDAAGDIETRAERLRVPVSLMATALQAKRNVATTEMNTSSIELLNSTDSISTDNNHEARDEQEFDKQEDDKQGVVLVIEDLSELLAAQRAAAWSEVARRLAHEIKNPLTPIQLSAERIRRNFRRAFKLDIAPMDSNNESISQLAAHDANVSAANLAAVEQTIEEGTRTIAREVTSLKKMVDEFSRFARLPSLRLERADLNQTIEQTIALYAERFAHIRFDVRLAPVLPHALIDHEQMRRVFINLFENAIEAVTACDDEDTNEGRITVATAHDSSRNLLLAEVADTGEGIHDEDHKRLFEPYFSTRERGTGLGLAIVHRIVTDHGGRIAVEPNFPRGARFRIQLPLDERRDEGGGMRAEESTQAKYHDAVSSLRPPPSSL